LRRTRNRIECGKAQPERRVAHQEVAVATDRDRQASVPFNASAALTQMPGPPPTPPPPSEPT
jgi:hypothetical protein